MIRLLVCDDHDLVRTSLVRALQAHEGLNVVAEASSPEEVLSQLVDAAASHNTPDVLLLDLSLGARGVSAGLGLLRQLQGQNQSQKLAQAQAQAQNQPMPVLVVSMHNDTELVSQALQAGASGYVTKDSSLDVLLAAIADVHQGRRYLSPNLMEPFLLASDRRHTTGSWDAALTPREREVLGRICAGQRMRDIALGLGLSIKTVSTHKVRLMTKLGVASNADLIRLGMKHGLG